MRHNHQLACECGSTLKLSHGVTGTAPQESEVIRVWESIHADHDRVTCEQARQIRFNSLRRTKTSLIS